MNVSRVKHNNNSYSYYLNGNIINNKILIDKMNSLRIPPAYTNVKINENLDDDILAIGEDNVGRKQYIYNPEYVEEQSEIKFCELINFGRKIKRIKKEINEAIHNYNNLDKEKLIYIVLYLIDNCNFRIGSKKYKELYNSYGVTTLNSSHFEFLKNYVKIEFVGKKGVINKSTIKNKNIYNILNKLCNDFNNQEFLFSYYSNNENKYISITDKTVNNFLQINYHKSLTVKMFRTWNANNILLKELLDLDIPYSVKEAENNINYIIKKIAHKLHHTPNVSKKSYIDNELLDLYKNNFKTFYKILNNFIENKYKFPSTDKLLIVLLEYHCNINK